MEGAHLFTKKRKSQTYRKSDKENMRPNKDAFYVHTYIVSLSQLFAQDYICRALLYYPNIEIDKRSAMFIFRLIAINILRVKGLYGALWLFHQAVFSTGFFRTHKTPDTVTIYRKPAAGRAELRKLTMAIETPSLKSAAETSSALIENRRN